MNIIETSNIGITKLYWCHICKQEFTRIVFKFIESKCVNCNSTFCEEINRENISDHPSRFTPFDINQCKLIYLIIYLILLATEPRRPNNPFSRGSRLHSSSSSILAFLNHLIESSTAESEDGEMDNIIQYLMQNDPNKYGNPPTSKEALSNLENKQINESELLELKKTNSTDCSVCKDEFDLEAKLIKLPCNHYFHSDCVKPWLLQRNSCPTCRFELPTDDTDYELRKQRSNSNV